MLLLLALPGLPLLLLVRRDVRRRLNLTRDDRVAVPGNGWGRNVWLREVVGPSVWCALLIAWPFVLARREAVTEYLVQRPWLILRTN